MEQKEFKLQCYRSAHMHLWSDIIKGIKDGLIYDSTSFYDFKIKCYARLKEGYSGEISCTSDSECNHCFICDLMSAIESNCTDCRLVLVNIYNNDCLGGLYELFESNLGRKDWLISYYTY